MSSSERRPGFFDDAYGLLSAPWDIGRPQPAIVELLDGFPPSGPVLEAGCGTGDLALELGTRGLPVLGVDSSELAIERAREKTAEAGLTELVQFRVGDGLHPTLLQARFGAALDSGFFHLFGQQERTVYAGELSAVLEPGGRFYLLGFGFDSPVPGAPKQVREQELRALFSPERGWCSLALRPARFVIRPAPDGVPAVAAVFERVAEG